MEGEVIQPVGGENQTPFTWVNGKSYKDNPRFSIYRS